MKVTCILLNEMPRIDTGKPFILDVEVSTAGLIAELAKRRPCDRCVYQQGHPVTCESCVWSSIIEADNFKEAK